jgi:hypothetical protein
LIERDLGSYQATVFRRPTRMARARASERTIAQVSVERERRVRGVDMERPP